VAELTIRAPSLDDLERTVAVLDSYAAERSDHRVTADEVRRWWTAPDFDLDWQALVAGGDRELVGYVDAEDPNGDGSQLWIDLRVPESGRRLGADARLLGEMEQRARSHASEGGVLRGHANMNDGRTVGLYRERGFEAVRYSFRMEASLAQLPAEPRWPDGIDVRAGDPADSGDVYAAYRESFADAWGAVEEPYADFLHNWGVGGDLDASLWFLAVEGGELAGVALCLPSRGGEDELGWVSVLGVRRPWRRRGLGRDLLLHAFRELRARGKQRVGLGVDADSPTGAVALYESVGMRVVNRFVSLEKPV
jgi:ribosomal protein S18 acetylase RimI-like enzyme